MQQSHTVSGDLHRMIKTFYWCFQLVLISSLEKDSIDVLCNHRMLSRFNLTSIGIVISVESILDGTSR